jgi:ethanolamine utilization microcompartment shell protein EutS
MTAGGFDRFAGCIILLGDVNGDCRALRSDDTVGDCADEITNPIEA